MANPVITWIKGKKISAYMKHFVHIFGCCWNVKNMFNSATIDHKIVLAMKIGWNIRIQIMDDILDVYGTRLLK